MGDNMRFGAIYGSGFGSPANMLGQPTDARRVRAGTAVEVRLTPAAGFGDAWYGIYVGSRLAGMIYAAEGTTTTRQAFPCASDTREALILRHGHQSQYDMSRIARRHYAATVAARATLSWTWPAQVIGVIAADGSENSDLSSWNVSGMLWSALEPGASDTRRKLSVDVSTSLGVTTITLKRYGVPVASGAVSAPGIAALAEQNSSGISGAVTVGAAPADTTGATLHIRFPQSLRVLRDQVDPPTTIQAIVDFN
ncbi:MAG: hypothetical protein ACE5FI_17600, partial [Anaerolineales bacterium]